MHSTRSSKKVYRLCKAKHTSKIDQHRSGQSSETVQPAETGKLGELKQEHYMFIYS